MAGKRDGYHDYTEHSSSSSNRDGRSGREIDRHSEEYQAALRNVVSRDWSPATRNRMRSLGITYDEIATRQVEMIRREREARGRDTRPRSPPGSSQHEASRRRYEPPKPAAAKQPLPPAREVRSPREEQTQSKQQRPAQAPSTIAKAAAERRLALPPMDTTVTAEQQTEKAPYKAAASKAPVKQPADVSRRGVPDDRGRGQGRGGRQQQGSSRVQKVDMNWAQLEVDLDGQFKDTTMADVPKEQQETVEKLIAQCDERIRSGTLHLHDLPLQGPVTKTLLSDVYSKAKKQNQKAAEDAEHRWWRENGIVHQCVRTWSLNEKPGSAGFPCTPCQKVGGVCYHRYCQHGSACWRKGCEDLHHAFQLMLMLAFCKLGMPTNEADDLAKTWYETHEWRFPISEYNKEWLKIVDPEKKHMKNQYDRPVKGSASVAPRGQPATGNQMPAKSAHLVEGLCVALIDIHRYYGWKTEKEQQGGKPPQQKKKPRPRQDMPESVLRTSEAWGPFYNSLDDCWEKSEGAYMELVKHWLAMLAQEGLQAGMTEATGMQADVAPASQPSSKQQTMHAPQRGSQPAAKTPQDPRSGLESWHIAAKALPEERKKQAAETPKPATSVARQDTIKETTKFIVYDPNAPPGGPRKTASTAYAVHDAKGTTVTDKGWAPKRTRERLEGLSSAMEKINLDDDEPSEMSQAQTPAAQQKDGQQAQDKSNQKTDSTADKTAGTKQPPSGDKSSEKDDESPKDKKP